MAEKNIQILLWILFVQSVLVGPEDQAVQDFPENTHKYHSVHVIKIKKNTLKYTHNQITTALTQKHVNVHLHCHIVMNNGDTHRFTGISSSSYPTTHSGRTLLIRIRQKNTFTFKKCDWLSLSIVLVCIREFSWCIRLLCPCWILKQHGTF